MPDPIRVLYVDDDDNSLEVRATILGEYGLDVVTETTVTDAERRLEEGDVDCVLSDLEMPDATGSTCSNTSARPTPASPLSCSRATSRTI